MNMTSRFLFALSIAFVNYADAGMITAEIDVKLEGLDPIPNATKPYATLTFEDIAAGMYTIDTQTATLSHSAVKVTLKADGLVGGTQPEEKLTEWYFNYAGSIAIADLLFLPEPPDAVSPKLDKIEHETDAYKMNNASGFFDIKVSFVSNQDTFFAGNSQEIIVYSNAGALSIDDFIFESAPPKNEAGGGYSAGLHIQSIGTDGSPSAKYVSTDWQGNHPAPEPASIALFGLGVFGAGFVTRRRRTNLAV